MKPEVTPQPELQTQSLFPVQQPNSQKPYLLLLLITVILILGGVTSYFGYQNWQLRQQVSQIETPPTPLTTPSLTLDPTINWITYTNTKYGFQFKHPSDLTIRPFAGSQEEPSLATMFKIDPEIGETISLVSVTSKKAPPTAGLVKGVSVNGLDAYYAYHPNGVPNDKTPFIVVEIHTNDRNVQFIFRNMHILSNTSNQILSTFKFTNLNQTVTINDWKSYTNEILKYSIKYPNDWIIDTSKAELPISTENSQELNISKGSYKLTILWPSAYGPNICLFDDQSKSGAPEMASYCEGEYIQYSSNEGKELHRRLAKPESFGDYQQWEVYTKEKSYFVTVPVIRFTAPLNFIADQVETMDQILSTYTLTN